MPVCRRPEQSAAHRSPSGRIAHALPLPLVFVLALALSAAAQGPVDGAIHGEVHDPHGRPVAATNVIVRSLDSGGEAHFKTAADGTFLVPHLAPGAYTLNFASPGFGPPASLPVLVTLGGTVEVHTGLALASVNFVVEVRADSAVSTSSALESSVSSTELAALPSRDRRWQDFALTVPAVNPDEDADGLLSVAGLPPTQNSVLIDGADATQSFHSVPAGTGSDPAPDPEGDPDSAELSSTGQSGLSRGRHSGAAYSFPQLAVREFRVSAQTYSAATGNAAGGVITTVSRSGTSALHGGVRFVLRSQALAAHNSLAVASSYAGGVVSSALVKPHDLRENFGITLGGPVPRLPSLRFFAALDVQRRGFPAIASPANPEFFRLSPAQLALLANRGVTRAAVDSALTFLSSLTGPTNRRADQNADFVRVDWRARQNAEFTGEYHGSRWNAPGGLLDAPVVARGRASLGNAVGSLDNVVLRGTSTLRPALLNQALLSLGRDLQFESPQSPLPGEPAIGPDGSAPEVNIGPSGFLFGTPASLSKLAFPDERRLGASDTLTLERGHHLLEVGGDFSFVDARVATLANAAGTFRYDSTRTNANAGGLADFITDYTFSVNNYPNGGCPSISAPVHLFCFTSFSQSFGGQSTDFSTQEYGAFAQDTWRPRPGVTVHAGVRYEYLLLPLPTAPNATIDAIFGQRGATGVFPEDRNNLGPRVALLLEPLGHCRGTLHVGYGVFFGRLPGATIRSALSDTALPSTTTRIRITPSTVTGCPQVASQGFGYPCTFTAQPPNVVASTSSAMVFDRRFRLPMVQQASLSVERAIGLRATISAGYLLRIAHQLAGSTDVNIAPASSFETFQLQGGTGAPGVTSGETFSVPLYTARLTPAFGPVTDIVSDVNASYNALVLTAETRGAAGVSARANYTWSRAIDYGPNGTATPRTDGQFDPFTHGYDKGVSSLDYPHVLHVAGVFRSGVVSAHREVRLLLSGWEVAPVLSARSGRPYTFDLAGGTRLPGGHLSLNGSGGALYLPTVGRNTLRLPASVNADLRVGRSFRPAGHIAGEPLALHFSAEVFNVLNHVNVTSVEQRAFLVGTRVSGVTPLVFQDAATIAAEGLNTRPFGTPTAAGASTRRERQVQLSVHLDF